MLSTRNLIIMALVLTIGAVISIKLFPDSAKGNINMAEAFSDFGRDQEQQVSSDAQQSTDNHTLDKSNQKAASKAVDEPDMKINKVADAKSFIDFKDWLNNFDEDDLDAGIELATVRKAKLALLLKTNPEQAYKESISFSDYEKLPKAVAALVEKPFSRKVDYSVIYADAAAGSPDAQSSQHGGPITSLRFTDEKTRYSAYTFGNRKNISSKKGIAAQGFTLDGDALLADEPMLVLTGDDLIYAKANFVDKRSKDTDAYTGEAIATEPVVGVAGGELFYFASEENVSLLNDDLKKLESRLGPNSGSQVLFSASAGSNDGSSTNTSTSLPLQASASVLLASSDPWTTSKKKVLFIRAVFPDKPEESISKEDLEVALNLSTSLQIKNMSRGKTWIEADVSDTVVMLPNDSSFYKPEGERHKEGELRNNAIEAFKVDYPETDLDQYDIVGVHFTYLGMGLLEDDGSYFSWAGLAGGSAQWLQGTRSIRVIVHEFGHNYGVGHAGTWVTDDGSSVSEQGYREEYGDSFDIMGSGPTPEGYFNPQFLSRLEWIDESEWKAVDSSGRHRIYRADHAQASGLQGLKVDRGDGSYYWLGYQQQFGSNSALSNGVYVLWQVDSTWESLLIDTTPESEQDSDSDLLDGAITLGRTYSDEAVGLYITALQKGGEEGQEWIDIQINYADSSDSNTASVTLKGPNKALTSKPTVFSVGVNGVSEEFLAYHWDFGDGTFSNSASSTSHTWASTGDYEVSVTVSNMKGVVASESIFVTVSSSTQADLGNWQQVQSNISNDLKYVEVVGTNIVAAGDNGVISISQDGGETWSSNTSWANADGEPVNVRTLKVYGLEVFNSRLNLIAREYISELSSWRIVVYTSSDGENWGRKFTSEDYSFGNVVGVTVGGNAIVINYDGNVHYSHDTENWFASAVQGSVRGVTYGNGIFLAYATVNKIFRSTNGATWELVKEHENLGSWYYFKQFAYLNGQFLIHIKGNWFVSEDQGESFTSLLAPEILSDLKLLTYANGVYIAVDESTRQFYQATNLSDWTLVEDISESGYDIAFYKNQFIGVGGNGGVYRSGIVSVIDNTITTKDSDSDGYQDHIDNCPSLSNQSQGDRDKDGLGNICDDDWDGDGVLNIFDAFPGDKSETEDLDNDGIGNNSDDDIDGDGVLNEKDLFPSDKSEWLDTDLDGIGNNTDTDDDGDGVLDTDDLFPLDKTEWADTDLDGIANGVDTDDDGDGVLDRNDPFPLDKTEWVDTDTDGIGNNTDTDDDGDGMPDVWESANGFDSIDSSDANLDFDNDELSNLQEYQAGTDPSKVDTDNNGLSDGQQVWVKVSSGDASRLSHVASGAGTILGLPHDGSHSGIYSKDGGEHWATDFTWTSLDGATQEPDDLQIVKLVYSKYSDKWALVGYLYDHDINSWVNFIYTSTNGSDWVQRYQAVYNGSNEFVDIASGSAGFVASHAGGVLYSQLGNTWVKGDIIGIDNYITSVVDMDGIFVGVAFDNKIWVSSNGINWSSKYSALPWGDNKRLVEVGGKLIVETDVWDENEQSYRKELHLLSNKGQSVELVISDFAYQKIEAEINGIYIVSSASGELYRSNSLDGPWLSIGGLSQNINEVTSYDDQFIAVGSGGDVYRSNPVEHGDRDLDGLLDNTDNCPSIKNTNQADLDSDGIGNVCDDDKDGDGVINIFDDLPLNSEESKDFDGDGVGDNSDNDDDNDGMPDIWETQFGLHPFDRSDAARDLDDDGETNLEEYLAGTDPTKGRASFMPIIIDMLLE